ncbi:MAG: fumarylacetoacetate hydrolase family protein [Vicingaceae bacterium]
MKIICIGRNYKAHASELGNAVPNEPVVFIKPDSAVIQSRNPFFIPEFSNDIHHEVEVFVRINRLGKHISKKFAHKYYDEIGLGIDFTARDLQGYLKSKGLPWEKAKSFDGSCLVGSAFNKDELSDLGDLEFRLEKNGQLVQIGNTKDMTFKIDEIIAHVSRFFTLKIGDLIFTGTPKGVGPVTRGDKLQGFLQDRSCFSLNIK